MLFSSVQFSLSAGRRALPEQTGHQINNALRRSTLRPRAVTLVCGSRGSDICSCFALLAGEPPVSPTCPRRNFTAERQAQLKHNHFAWLRTDAFSTSAQKEAANCKQRKRLGPGAVLIHPLASCARSFWPTQHAGAPAARDRRERRSPKLLKPSAGILT